MVRILAIVTLMLFLAGCGMSQGENSKIEKVPKFLEDIAYAHNLPYDCKVYINEGGAYIPYLVLSNNYNGNCLLLRENLLDDSYIFNNAVEKPAYYENSAIDRYLNESFIKIFSKDLQKIIVESEIEITSKDSLGVGGTDTITIKRNVFLLSFAEVNAGYSRTNLEEGTALDYFADKNKRIALYRDGTAGSWWLRTPNTSGRSIVCGVSKEGIVGIGGIYDPNIQDGYYNGVRPAFCLPNDTKIERVTIDGVSILVINTS